MKENIHRFKKIKTFHFKHWINYLVISTLFIYTVVSWLLNVYGANFSYFLVMKVNLRKYFSGKRIGDTNNTEKLISVF
ncbi:hypothetical protein CUS89_01530 [Enterococcus mundtii]|uniref:Uncharacterized protein n=1 Tax=Enterococcus mundtii TaxID=53346 RepID=A0A2S7RZ62_ENTMU|nr:hypothetical protein CUS89_01530 [Enterococcus mundtii]